MLARRVAGSAADLADRWCRRCGCEGRARDNVTRRLAHEPLGWRPTTLLTTARRYRCTGCGHVWRKDTSRAPEPRAKLSRNALRWALIGLVCQHLTVARLAEALAVSHQQAIGGTPSPGSHRASTRRGRSGRQPSQPGVRRRCSGDGVVQPGALSGT